MRIGLKLMDFPPVLHDVCHLTVAFCNHMLQMSLAGTVSYFHFL